jgi:hypothetical protein
MHRRLIIAAIVLQASSVAAADLAPISSITFQGNITEPLQLSGVTRHGSLLVICPDEGSTFDVLEPADSNSFRLVRSIDLSDEPMGELDLEGAASDGDSLFLVGSHSLARRKVSPDKEYSENQSRMLKVNEEKSRDQLFRLTLGEHGKLKQKESISLRKLLREDKHLGRFADIPSKENGIDIEGIAVRGRHVYLGFRSPVLRENFVPVMVLAFDSPQDYELRFLNLDGCGIRDLAAVKDGFLLIAGPPGDGAGTFQLCYWNGKDCVPGTNAPTGKVFVLGNIPSQHEAKAEGLAVLSEDEREYKVLVLYDGLDHGGAQSFVVRKPANQ